MKIDMNKSFSLIANIMIIFGWQIHALITIFPLLKPVICILVIVEFVMYFCCVNTMRIVVSFCLLNDLILQ